MLHQLTTTPEWDMVIIGGGATGIGAALDATSRGYKTLLIEQHDFAKGTSSRSTKLVHGGVRYLEQGNIKLVREALRERGYLLHNAPHLTSVQPFIVPVYSWWEKMYYAIGLKIYDLLSGKLSLGKTQVLSRKETMQRLTAIDPSRLAGGILYFDGQFDDSRLATDMAATAAANGATLLNYCKATGFAKTNGKISGVKLRDSIHENIYEVKTKAVINATGVFTDAVLQMDDAERHELVSPSQGIHLVVDKEFFPGTDAMMIPKTDDGRVLFAVPWHDKVVLGTTDTPVDHASIEPQALEEEIAFIIKHINRYGKHTILRSDVKSIFAGLRPLVKTKTKGSTALLSRDHTLVISPSGLVTITGGKWTTYRKMAEDAVDNALFISKQEKRACVTPELAIGNIPAQQRIKESLIEKNGSLAEKLHPEYAYTLADVLYAVKYEMAQTVEDVLARRTRLLFLDATAAMQCARQVALLMKDQLQKEEGWAETQVQLFNTLAKQYLLS
ncbi:MAG: glycerol-3-phosphate dehydrogenase/oxidase [Bacteroidota bacterium]